MNRIIKKYYYTFIENLARKIGVIPKAKKRETLTKKGNLVIGDYTYGHENIDFQIYKGSECKVEIGKFCSIGPNAKIILGGIHPPNWVSLYPFRINFKIEGAYTDGMPSTNGNIVIGNDVWIGTDVTILSGITIGNGAIIATGSLVTKNVEPYTIVGGVPCKLIKKRFSDEVIAKLEKISWWNWDEEKIMDNIHLFSSSDVEEFITKHSL
jgi:acetyltransferase-like isoleucine patch superfamily enzyme